MSKTSIPYQLWKACVRKRAFATQAAAAAQKGMDVYRCQHCGQWHRTSGVNKLVAQLRRVRTTRR